MAKERIADINPETCFAEIPVLDAAGWLSAFIRREAGNKARNPPERLLFCRCCQMALCTMVSNIDKDSLTEDEKGSLSVTSVLTEEERFRELMEETLSEIRGGISAK